MYPKITINNTPWKGKIFTIQTKETEKIIILEHKGRIVKKEIIQMLTYEEQLDKLLALGLKIHPLEEDGCWGVFASTPAKAVKRFDDIKRIFPKAIPIELKSNLEGDFGVDLYMGFEK